MRPISSWPAAFLLAATLALPAGAQTAAPAVIPAVGGSAHYRVTRLAQGNAGPRSLSSDITLHRKSAGSLTLKGIAGDPASETTALTVGPDGTLQFAATDTAAAANGALVDVVNGLNRLTELFAGETSIPQDGWSPTLRLPDVRGSNASVAVPVAVEHAGAGGFELHGVGEFTIAPPATSAGSPQRPALQRRRGYRGSMGYPGSAAGVSVGSVSPEGFEGGVAPAATTAPARQPVTVAVSVDGRVRHGAIGKIAIVETRSVTVDGQPYVSVSGWTIERLK